MKNKESAYVRKEPRNLQSRGSVTGPQPSIKIAKRMTITKIEVIKTNDQPTTTIKIAKSMTITKIELSRRTINLLLR